MLVRDRIELPSGDIATSQPTPPPPTTPETRLHALLADGRLTLAAAESCTGGGVAGRITALAGSSAYFLGGVVAYANSAKRDLLGVSPETLATRGAVSAECARAMAEGARRVFGADVAVATTGIAGPGGGTVRKPVGLVFLAAAGPGGVTVSEHRFTGDRAAVTAAATEAALRLLLARVEDALVAAGTGDAAGVVGPTPGARGVGRLQ